MLFFDAVLLTAYLVGCLGWAIAIVVLFWWISGGNAAVDPIMFVEGLFRARKKRNEYGEGQGDGGARI